MVNVTFVMEQHIGHRAYYENLRRFLDRDPTVTANWVEVTYHDENNPWQRLPILPRSFRGTLIGRQQARRGLAQPADAAFFNTQVPATLSGNLNRRRPYIIATDITPVQYDRMAKWYGHRPDRGGLLGRYKQQLNTRTLRNAAYLLPWSSWARKSLIEEYGVKPERVETLPPGVDLDVWRPASRKIHSPFRILFVGGHFDRKGGSVLLKAYQQLTQQFPPGHLEIAIVTRSQVPTVPGVRIYSDLTPNSPELIHLYQSSDVFVLPSLAEAFGIAAVEACAAGLPVISSNVGGLVDIVEDGCTGFLIEPGAVQPLINRLALLFENQALRERMGQAGRRQAERIFNASQNASRTAQILQEIAQRG